MCVCVIYIVVREGGQTSDTHRLQCSGGNGHSGEDIGQERGGLGLSSALAPDLGVPLGQIT